MESRVKTRRKRGRRRVLSAIFESLNIRIAATDAIQAKTALDAHVRLGRGAPATLNLGDCFAYALAAAEGDGPLFKGEEFPKTDIRSAL